MPYPDDAIPKYVRRTHFIRLLIKTRKIQETSNYNRAAAQAQITLFQDKVSALLSIQGIWADLRHQYLAYAQALDKSQRTMRFMVDWVREHNILRDRFERRGLDPTTLDAVDQLVIYRTRDL
jgi:hypothetical protein